MLINQDIKNLVQGVSQQPPILRNPEQLEEQLNGYSSEAAGLQKRPPTMFVAKLQTYINGNKPLIHMIDRDSEEQYVVLFDGEGVNVYGLNGTKYTVNYVGNTQEYLRTQYPRRVLKCVTIADYTFIVNTTKKVLMSSVVPDTSWDTQGVLVNVKSGQYGRKYKIELNGSQVALFETPDGSDKMHTTQIATDHIAHELATQCITAGYTVVEGSSWIYVYGRAITKVKVSDGFNNQALFAVMRSTQKFTNLPASAPDGFTCKIVGEKGSTTDDYYVRYSEASEVWEECAKPGLINGLDAATMPHVLVREANNTFTFKVAEWNERDVGDEDSNPKPSFVDQTINNIFYFRNRLGLLSGENVILTRSGDFFNFWVTSAMETQDTDPIDLAVSDNTIATLYHAVPFDTNLIIFSRDAQFTLMTSNVLTPKDAYIPPPVTHFGCSTKATPVAAGRNIYFAAERSQFTTMREFFTAQDNTESRDVQDITSHVPSYIPNGVYKIISSSTENIFLCLTEGEENALYVYKYLFIDGQRQQASWSKWDLDDTIYGGSFINNYLYLVVERNNYLCLERISFTFNTEDLPVEKYRVMLDSKRNYLIPQEAYNSITNSTTLNIAAILGDLYDPLKQYSVVTHLGDYKKAENGVVNFEGDYSNTTVVVGINYLFKAVMSTLYVKQVGQTGIEALLEGRLQVRNMWVNCADSGTFDILVDTDTNHFIYKHTSRLLGTLSNILGVLPLTTETFRFPVQSLNTNCTITIQTEEPLPVSLVGAGWVGNYVRRTKRY